MGGGGGGRGGKDSLQLWVHFAEMKLPSCLVLPLHTETFFVALGLLKTRSKDVLVQLFSFFFTRRGYLGFHLPTPFPPPFS